MEIKTISNLDSTNYKGSKFTNDSIKDMVINRNDMLIKFAQIVYDDFIKLSTSDEIKDKMKFGDIPNVRIIGNPHQPTIVFNNEFIISCFVKNFIIYFSTDFSTDGEILGKCDLNVVNEVCGRNIINDIITSVVDRVSKKQLYKLSIDNSFYSYICGQGHVYMSRTNPQLFYELIEINNVADLLYNLGYESVEIIGNE